MAWNSGGRRVSSGGEDGMNTGDGVEDHMLTLLEWHQTLLAAGHDQIEIACLAGVSVRSVRRIAGEAAVEHVDDRQERIQRRIGRPSKVASFRTLVRELVEQVNEEDARTAEIGRDPPQRRAPWPRRPSALLGGGGARSGVAGCLPDVTGDRSTNGPG